LLLNRGLDKYARNLNKFVLIPDFLFLTRRSLIKKRGIYEVVFKFKKEEKRREENLF
jgi:hypothetical protein